MSQRDQKTHEKPWAHRGKPAPQEEEYDLYLFWPSLSNQDVSSGDTPSSPLYGPVSLHSESTDYDSSMLGSGPPSPIMFAPVLDSRLPLPAEEAVDFGASPASPLKEPDALPQAREENAPAKYSTIVKMADDTPFRPFYRGNQTQAPQTEDIGAVKPGWKTRS